MSNELNWLDNGNLGSLLVYLPVLPDGKGRFIGELMTEDIGVTLNDEYQDPKWVFSIEGFKEYKEYYDHGA